MSYSTQAVLRSTLKRIVPSRIRKEIRKWQARIQHKAQEVLHQWERVKWLKVAAKNDSVVVEIASGVKMKLYRDSMLSEYIFLNKFETDERDFMLRFLRPDDVYVDVGANAGFFTLIAAKLVGEHGQVIAFEPSSKTYDRLSENICINGFKNVRFEQCAISSSTGQADLMVAQDNMDPFNSFVPHKGKNYTQEKVPTSTWDDFADRSSLHGRVVLMKIDVEGWEAHVLSGGREYFSREDAPVLQVEFTEEAAVAAGTSCQENYQILENLGYKIYVYDPNSKTLVLHPMQESYLYLNVYAAKNLAFVQSRLAAEAMPA